MVVLVMDILGKKNLSGNFGNFMVKKSISHEQFNLFGVSTVIHEPKKKRNILSPEERKKRKEKDEAHTAWKLLKSGKFYGLLTERQKYLLKKHYGIDL